MLSECQRGEHFYAQRADPAAQSSAQPSPNGASPATPAAPNGPSPVVVTVVAEEPLRANGVDRDEALLWPPVYAASEGAPSPKQRAVAFVADVARAAQTAAREPERAASLRALTPNHAAPSS